MRTIEQMVQQEILCCMSSIVSTLANGSGTVDAQSRNSRRDDAGSNLSELCEQAFELASPVPDYEEAAIQEGWRHDDEANEYRLHDKGDGPEAIDANKSWEELCIDHDIEPYDREVYEHWAVTTWFAEKLIEQGEKVDLDFGALNVWARTTTGQAISMDGCVQRIYAAMMAPVPAEG